MIAQVRLFRDRACVSPRAAPPVWCFVLAGGVSRRGPAAFERALDRATRLAPPHRVVAVVSRESAARCGGLLGAGADVATIVQPVYRGSAAELFLPALLVARRDPDAVIVALRADDLHEGPVAPSLSRSVRAVARRPDLTVLVGARPRCARLPDGFVEPGSPLPGLEDLSLRTVRRFVYDAPRGLAARDVLAPAALAARAGMLVALGRRYVPDVLETLEPLEDVADAAEATLLCEAVYECMPYASLSRELLERIADLAVLPVPDALCDVGGAAVPLASSA
jgi:mannose-1-phosphate guanylyltransferase